MLSNNLGKKIIFLVLLVTILIPSARIFAQDESPTPILIRDAEIEYALRMYSTPLFKAAGIPPEDVKIYIIQDKTLNAFVANGMNMFFHTGLITFSEDPLVLTGVMAHEIGHIAGGHLVRKNEIYEKAMLGTALSYVLGAATVVAGGGQAGAAIITGGQHVAMQNVLQHSRVHEQSADQAGLGFLDKAGISAKGLMKLLQELGGKETLFYNDVNPYTLTHPLSQERVTHLQNHLDNSKLTDKPAPKNQQEIQQRIVAKINAFLEDPEKTFAAFPESDTSVKARYARAIAWHRKPDLAEAIAEIDSLLAESPDDAYFNELKGQILFEHGKVKESIPFYSKALQLLPDSDLISLELASAQIATEDRKLLPEAIRHLEKSVAKHPDSAVAWHQLGIAYGRDNQLGLSYLALAEEAALTGNKKDSLDFTQRAEGYLKPDDPAMLRAKDIRQFLDNKYPDKGLF